MPEYVCVQYYNAVVGRGGLGWFYVLSTHHTVKLQTQVL